MEFKMNHSTFKVRSEVGLVLLRVSPTQRNTTPVPVACASIPCGRFSNHLIKTFSLTREKFINHTQPDPVSGAQIPALKMVSLSRFWELSAQTRRFERVLPILKNKRKKFRPES